MSTSMNIKRFWLIDCYPLIHRINIFLDCDGKKLCIRHWIVIQTCSLTLKSSHPFVNGSITQFYSKNDWQYVFAYLLRNFPFHLHNNESYLLWKHVLGITKMQPVLDIWGVWSHSFITVTSRFTLTQSVGAEEYTDCIPAEG